MSQLKITVVKKLNTNDLFGNNPPLTINEKRMTPECDRFKTGQEFILDNIERGDETIFTGSLDKNKICKDFIEEINKELKAKDKKGELRLSTSYLPIKGGVVIGFGKIRKNISLEFLLKKIREELEIQVSKDLFN